MVKVNKREKTDKKDERMRTNGESGRKRGENKGENTRE